MRFTPFLGLLLLASPLAAQGNQDPDIDVALVQLGVPTSVGREGTFPQGSSGFAYSTTVCNVGNAVVPWFAPMSGKHPVIGFLLAREKDGRLEQLSDRSFVKHGFLAGTGRACGSCTLPAVLGEELGLGCSDTYSTSTNGDRYYLGPPDEIDPWLGKWTSACSLFDRGEPEVASPDNCDGTRSFTHSMASALPPTAHLVRVDDAELNVSGASFFCQAHYVVKTEPEPARSDNTASLELDVAWQAGKWNFSAVGGIHQGPVLGRWSGAVVSSNTNGADDGRVYAAVKVSAPVEGFYHYEYALQNRDNARGVGAFRIPTCAGARVKSAGFRDIDDDASNDWSVTVAGGEIVFETPSDPQRWNTIYNFWFDCDAAPESGALTLDAFDAGQGAPFFTIASSAPTGLYNAWTGPGCGPSPPSLYATGTPARAQLGNASFGLESAGNPAGASNLLIAGVGPVRHGPLGCSPTAKNTRQVFSLRAANAAGVARHPFPIPADPSFEGLVLEVQALTLIRAVGPRPGTRQVIVSDGLRVRVGDLVVGCP
jgi:hypothetical protein